MCVELTAGRGTNAAPVVRPFFFLCISLAAFVLSCCSSAPPPSAVTDEPQTQNAETVEEIPVQAQEAYPEEGRQEYQELIDAETEAALPENTDGLPASSFDEVWAYLLSGQDKILNTGYPISDLVHFAAEVDSYGHLSVIPRRKAITRFKGRVHLAVVCDSAGLTHFVIQGGSEARKQLVAEILAAAKDYDGLNVDIERVPERDTEHFLSFLSELRAGLGGRTLSVCVPGRTRAGGPYSYASIAGLADRVFVMAYDEHWSGGPPGPVASMNWCKAVADYGLHAIGQEKLVMGIPFYGRSWGDKSTSRALVHRTTESQKREYGAQDFHRVNGIPTFTYDVTVKVTVYYEDEYSLAARMRMYRGQGVQKIGFWRLGQEAPGVWNLVKLDGG
ncbi:MAG: glycoside hydrolase [Spirochaetaceae bacterium]|nr:glycoside hydrolase [Spirochaetaceae bacterium]